MNGLSPTEVLKSDALSDECKEELDIEGFSKAYENVLEKCKTELTNVGSEKPLAYLGKMRSKVSKTCSQAMQAIRKFLPPPPDSGKR